jgi:hypothetical protein
VLLLLESCLVPASLRAGWLGSTWVPVRQRGIPGLATKTLALAFCELLGYHIH